MDYPYRTDALERLHPDGWRDIQPRLVAVQGLKPTQPDVSIERFFALDNGAEPETGDPYPHVVLHDGHHRWVLAQLLRPQSALYCRVVNEAGEPA